MAVLSGVFGAVFRPQSTLDSRLRSTVEEAFVAASTSGSVDIEGLKREAAARALDDVRDGMKLGLGTGSTARHFVELLGAKVRAGLKVVGVPTSEATRAQAAACGIPLATLDDTPQLDLTV